MTISLRRTLCYDNPQIVLDEVPARTAARQRVRPTPTSIPTTETRRSDDKSTTCLPSAIKRRAQSLPLRHRSTKQKNNTTSLSTSFLLTPRASHSFHLAQSCVNLSHPFARSFFRPFETLSFGAMLSEEDSFSVHPRSIHDAESGFSPSLFVCLLVHHHSIDQACLSVCHPALWLPFFLSFFLSPLSPVIVECSS